MVLKLNIFVNFLEFFSVVNGGAFLPPQKIGGGLSLIKSTYTYTHTYQTSSQALLALFIRGSDWCKMGIFNEICLKFSLTPLGLLRLVIEEAGKDTEVRLFLNFSSLYELA
jgi:hypothetical protein